MSELNKKQNALSEAWEELKKFGNHEGDCTFDGTCETCGAMLGRCDLHADTMALRMDRMEKAIMGICEDSDG